MDADATLPPLRELLATVARLRAPDGCPWDRAQTLASLAPHLLEEAFEAAEALATGAAEAARAELGDVLVNVVLLSQIAAEAGQFDLAAVAGVAAQKLVRRHPHVFGEQKVDGQEAAYRNWERQKQAELRAAGTPASVLAGVPQALPALLRAFRIGEKAARAGFDWPDRHGPRQKVDEELAELDEAVASGDGAAIAEEVGDVLFSVCNLARHLGVNPESALAATTRKFQRRFQCVEQAFGYDLRGQSLEAMDAAWRQAKAAERPAGGGGPSGG
jgi:MazG family protein